MKLTDAQSTIREVHTKNYAWLKAYGISTVREAVRTIQDRKSATQADREIASDVERKLYERW
jgi:hypothetical protein